MQVFLWERRPIHQYKDYLCYFFVRFRWYKKSPFNSTCILTFRKIDNKLNLLYPWIKSWINKLMSCIYFRLIKLTLYFCLISGAALSVQEAESSFSILYLLEHAQEARLFSNQKKYHYKTNNFSYLAGSSGFGKLSQNGRLSMLKSWNLLFLARWKHQISAHGRLLL